MIRTDQAVRVGSTANPDTKAAIDELLETLGAADAALTLVFFAPSHDDEIIARRLDDVCQDRGVAGTTAGELSALGFTERTMTGMSFHGEGVRAAVDVVPQLSELSLLPVVGLPDRLIAGIGRTPAELDPQRHLWLLLVDGLSPNEDMLTPFFMQAAPRVGLVGGSLGDGGDFQDVRLVHHGRTYRDAALVVLLEYDRPFHSFHHTHMEITDRWVEVTATNRGGRVITQLDGRPATEAYAAALGVGARDVRVELTSSRPLGYRFRGKPFPCSILHPNDDGSLTMASSIQVGDRLNILEPTDIVATTDTWLRESIDAIEARGERVQGLLLFHCLGRYIEARELDVLDELFDALNQAPLCGLNTYGEQYESRHMNHSMTGVVFG